MRGGRQWRETLSDIQCPTHTAAWKTINRNDGFYTTHQSFIFNSFTKRPVTGTDCGFRCRETSRFGCFISVGSEDPASIYRIKSAHSKSCTEDVAQGGTLVSLLA